MNRKADLKRFYNTLNNLERRLGGKRKLENCNGRMDWPKRGVYFFFEEGERRSETGDGLRVARVGTHAIKSMSRSTLWGRLSQHRGVQKTSGGNHRGSIFRLLVGMAIKNRDGLREPSSWGIGGSHSEAARRFSISREKLKQSEHDLEVAVSRFIRSLPFLWIGVDDPPGQDSKRNVIERNAIALLSNYKRPSLDPPSDYWLGTHSDRQRVRDSGLWNNNHVDEHYDTSFLLALEKLTNQI